MKLHRLHRILGLALFLLVVNSAATGMLRANARWWYWKDRPPRQQAVSLSPPTVGMERLFSVLGGMPIRRVELKPLAGKTVYLVECQNPERPYVLVDASSGGILSPLTAESAVEVARAFVDRREQVVLTEWLPSYAPRKGNGPRPVWRVVFGDASRTEVVVDQETGAVLTMLDRGRRFGLWVVKLHELDFFNCSRPALTLLGLGVTFLAITGLTLGLRGKGR